jgi:hypothetical protein
MDVRGVKLSLDLELVDSEVTDLVVKDLAVSVHLATSLKPSSVANRARAVLGRAKSAGRTRWCESMSTSST